MGKFKDILVMTNVGKIECPVFIKFEYNNQTFAITPKIESSNCEISTKIKVCTHIKSGYMIPKIEGTSTKKIIAEVKAILDKHKSFDFNKFETINTEL